MLQPDLTDVDRPVDKLMDPIAVQLTLAFFESAAEMVFGQAEEICCDSGDRSSEPTPTPRQEQSPYDEQANRIQHLERALDQALLCMEEMRQRVQDQVLLEAQLIATEQFASVQQQAITRLKVRLKQQQQQLRTQMLEAEARDRIVQEQLVAAESLVQAQQAELQQLRAFLNTASLDNPAVQANWQVHLGETQQQTTGVTEVEVARANATQLQKHLQAAQQQVQELNLKLNQAEERISDLEEELQIQQSSREARAAHKRTLALCQPNPAIATLGQDLARAQIKIEELEIELSRQLRLQAMWQQGHHELEEAGERYRNRISELEEQTAEMQEQILLQVRQAAEYETAIQHWKDRSVTSLRRLAHLRERLTANELLAVAPADSPLQAALVELVNLLEMAASESECQAPSEEMVRNNPWDVPDFLLWRRTHRR